LGAEIIPAGAENKHLRFLLIEDNPTDVELLEYELRQAGFQFSLAVVQTAEEFTRELRANAPHVVMADYNLPSWSGMEALKIIAREGQDIPLILVTGTLADTIAVDCIKQGATDYVLKGALARLPIAIRRALQEKNLREQRKRVEENLAHSKRDLDLYAHVASHDLQEPLRMVVSYTQLLAARYSGRLDEDADQFIGYAVDGARRMQALLKDLLSVFGDLETKTDYGNTECDAALAHALQNLASAIKESAAIISYGPLPSIAAEPGHLVNLFENLIGNSVKFRAKEIPTIRISAEREGTNWIFAVADNGIGISPEYRDRIFVIFQRLHNREEYSGNGVGLAISKKIVEHYGGRIWVESEPGRGSTFKFTFPVMTVSKPNSSLSKELTTANPRPLH
jgi:signal transduction histidine kinase